MPTTDPIQNASGNNKNILSKENPDGFYKKNLVIFASGAGTNAREIINYFKTSITAAVILIVCNKKEAGVIAIAEENNISVLMVERQHFLIGDAYVPELKKVKADLIILAGFLWKIPSTLLIAFPNKIINIHPALLPNYGGKGMYGKRVHEAVLQAGEVQSGLTIHFVNESYDDGATILQVACPVLEGDTAEKLAERILKLEHLYYPKVIDDLCKTLV
ncbi:MAG: phosphoribosylglycinamide formyltransferase [Flavisolibacter sp.]